MFGLILKPPKVFAPDTHRRLGQGRESRRTFSGSDLYEKVGLEWCFDVDGLTIFRPSKNINRQRVLCFSGRPSYSLERNSHTVPRFQIFMTHPSMLTPAQIASWMAKPRSAPLSRTPSGNTLARQARLRAEANRRQAALAARANLKKKRVVQRWKKAVGAVRTAQRAIRKMGLLPGHGSRSKAGLTNAELRALSAYNMLTGSRVLKRAGSNTYRTFA
jgi:hypothetical protein